MTNKRKPRPIVTYVNNGDGWTLCKVCLVSILPGTEVQHARQNQARHPEGRTGK